MPEELPLADIAERQLRQVCALLDRRLRAGESCTAEDLLNAHPLIAEQTELAVELVYTEFVLREELGQQPRAVDFCRRFPKWKDRLERLLGVHAALGQSTSQSLSALGDIPPPREGNGESYADKRLSGDLPTLRGPVSPRTVPPQTSLPRMFGSYLLLGEIGRGGMGVVYQARHLPLDRIVAVKMIPDGIFARPDQRARFRKEAEAIAQVNHPNVVQIYEVNEHDGHPFLALEYVNGGSLAQQLQKSPLRSREAAALVRSLAQAVQAAHDQGIIHRDLKPANVLLAGEPSRGSDESPAIATTVPKITDFGLAAISDEESARLTRTGQLVGTPSYMAPEQADPQHHDITPAADVYGLGAILYELLTGRPPFLASTVMGTVQQVIHLDPVPPTQLQPGCPRDLETIVLKCLRKEPTRRYARAADLADDLTRFLENRPIAARPVSPFERCVKWVSRHPAVASLILAVILVSLLGAASAAWQWRQVQQERDQAIDAREKADKARLDEERHRKVGELRWYLNQIARVEQEHLANNAGYARRLLQESQSATPHLCNWEWHYLNTQTQGYLLSLPEQRLNILGVAISSCGRYLASSTGEWNGTEAGEVRLWNARTGELLRKLTGPRQAIYSVAFQPGGNLLAAGDTHGSLWLWDLSQPEQQPVQLAQESGVSCVAFHPGGAQLGCGLMNGMVKIIDVKSYRVLNRSRFTNKMALRLDFHPAGNQLAIASRSGLVYLWDLPSNKLIRSLPHSDDARHALFCPDGRLLAVAGFEGNLKVWDLQNLTVPVATFPLAGGAVTALGFSPDGQNLVIGLIDGRLLLWEFRRLAHPRLLHGHSGYIAAVAFSRDGRKLAAGGTGRSVVLWDLASLHDVRIAPLFSTTWVVAMASGTKGPLLALAGGRNRRSPGQTAKRHILLYDGEQGQLIQEFPETSSFHTAVAISSDEKQIAGGYEDGNVRLWDVQRKALIATLKVDTGSIHAVTYSPNGMFLATGSRTGVQLWDATARKVATRLPHSAPVLTVAFAPTGKQLATGSEDGKVRIWQLPEGKLVRTLEGTAREVGAVSFSPDGKYLAACDRLRRLRLWNTESWEETTSEDRIAPALPAARDPGEDVDDVRQRVVGLAFSPDSKRLVFITNQYRVLLVDVASGRGILHLATPGDSRCDSVVFSPDGKRVHAMRNGSLLTWDTQTLDAREKLALAERRGSSYHEQQLSAGEMIGDSPWTENPFRPGAWFVAAFHAKQLCDLAPKDGHWYQRLATAQANLGLWSEARKNYEIAIERQGGHVNLYYSSAFVDLVQGNWAGARKNYAAAANRLGGNVDLFYSRAATFLAAGESSGYLRACEEMFKRFGKTKDAYEAAQLLYACLPMKDAGDPRQMVKLARTVTLRYMGPERLLAAALFRQGEYRLSLERFAMAAKLRQGPRAWDWYFQAMAHHHLGNDREARDCLRKATAWIEETEKQYPTRWIRWRERHEVAALRAEAEALLGSGGK